MTLSRLIQKLIDLEIEYSNAEVLIQVQTGQKFLVEDVGISTLRDKDIILLEGI